MMAANRTLNTSMWVVEYSSSSNIRFCVSAVKPDPPERVTATPMRFNARRLEVSWHSPSTWPDIDNFPLKYFLRYRPLIREQWQHVSTATLGKPSQLCVCEFVCVHFSKQLWLKTLWVCLHKQHGGVSARGGTAGFQEAFQKYLY